MSLKLDQLADRAGVSPRTVRYYIQRGVLPAPDFKGPDTAYDERHLHGLRAIKRLQEAYWPLDAIVNALAGKTESELRELAHGPLPTAPGAAPEVRPAAPALEGPPLATARGERITLAPGLELWVEDGADRGLVDAVLQLAREASPAQTTKTPKTHDKKSNKKGTP